VSIKVKVESGDLARRAEQAAERAMEIVLGELNAAFRESFDFKAWDWPRDLPTRGLDGTLAEKAKKYRQGKGKRAGNPRNLIDEGNLRRAASWQMSGKYQAAYKWSAEYATLVHQGGWIRPWGNDNVRILIPARPWTRAVLGQEQVSAIKPFPFEKRLKDVWIAKFKAT
jgi:hypothetical protein